jgi:hypothetical protein
VSPKWFLSLRFSHQHLYILLQQNLTQP